MSTEQDLDDREWEQEGSGVIRSLGASASEDLLLELRNIFNNASLTPAQTRERVFALDDRLSVDADFLARHGKRIPWHELIEEAMGRPKPPPTS